MVSGGRGWRRQARHAPSLSRTATANSTPGIFRNRRLPRRFHLSLEPRALKASLPGTQLQVLMADMDHCALGEWIEVYKAKL